MKRNPIFLATLSQETLIEITTEVKEVLANQHKKTDSKSLSILDLWNIQRRQKARPQRRYF